MKINQFNGKAADNVRKILAGKVNCVIKKAGKTTCKLLDRLLRDTAININATSCDGQEERRIRWTTYNNIKSWFENWENDLVELGFAYRGNNGNVEIPVNATNYKCGWT